MVSLEWPWTTLRVVETKSGNRLSQSCKNVSLSDSGSPACIKSLVHLGKLRKEQSGDATELKKNAMRSVLGALGYFARESQPDLSGPAFDPAKSFQQSSGAGHPRNESCGQTG